MTRPCAFCSGTFRPIPGDVDRDNDGSEITGLRCDRNPAHESAHYGGWR